MGLQAFEVVVPKSFVVGHPIPYRAQPLRDKAIMVLSSLTLFGNQAGIKQDTQMLGYGWPAHFKVSGYVFDGLVPFDQKIQDPAPGGTADGFEYLRLMLNHRDHEKKIGKQVLTCQVPKKTTMCRSWAKLEEWVKGAVDRVSGNYLVVFHPGGGTL
jgi:hypothetical protein